LKTKPKGGLEMPKGHAIKQPGCTVKKEDARQIKLASIMCMPRELLLNLQELHKNI